MTHFIRSTHCVLAIAVAIELATVGCGSSSPSTRRGTGGAGRHRSGRLQRDRGRRHGGRPGGRGRGEQRGGAGTTGGRGGARRRQRRRGRRVHRRRLAGGRSLDAGAVRDGDRKQRRSRGRRRRRRRRGADVHAVSSDGPAAGRALPPRDHAGATARARPPTSIARCSITSPRTASSSSRPTARTSRRAIRRPCSPA